jgi:hypothetical protein
MKWIIACCLSLFLGMSPSLAAVIAMGSGSPTYGQLKSACATAGGEFVDQRDVGAGYSCHVPNCDGQGNECKIDCGSQSCTATTPIVIGGPTTLVGILKNGNAVVHGQSVGGGSLSSPGTVGVPAPSPLL